MRDRPSSHPKTPSLYNRRGISTAVPLPIGYHHAKSLTHRLFHLFMLNLDRITFDLSIMGGQACIRGMRIPVSLVVNLVANGKPEAEILAEYPDLESEDIRQSLFLSVMRIFG